jgi:RNA recognition motif-containing protein
MRIYVGNLSYQTSEQDLRELFSGFGEIQEVFVVTDRYSGQSRGFGFVEMPNQDEANRAIAELNGKEVDGRQVVVNEARPRRDRDSGGPGGGRHRY